MVIERAQASTGLPLFVLLDANASTEHVFIDDKIRDDEMMMNAALRGCIASWETKKVIH